MIGRLRFAIFRERGSDILISLGLVFLAIYVQSAAGRFSELGAIFPRAVASIIAALGVVLMLSALMPRGFKLIGQVGGQRRGDPVVLDVEPVQEDPATLTRATPTEAVVMDGEGSASSSALPAYVVIGGLILWVALIPRIGFVIASTLGLIAFSMAILGRARWSGRNLISVGLFSVLAPVAIHFIMKEYLLVPLP